MIQAKRATAHLRAILRGVLFIGTNVQIALGIAWMCCNFGRIQDFKESGSVVYRGIFRLFWGNAPVLHTVQLAAAFGAGYCFLRNLRRYLSPQKETFGSGEETRVSGEMSAGRAARRLSDGRVFAAWGSLALLTFPFAMQCHLALLPCSFQASLFLLGLSFLLKSLTPPERGFEKKEGAFGRKEGTRRLRQEEKGIRKTEEEKGVLEKGIQKTEEEKEVLEKGIRKTEEEKEVLEKGIQKTEEGKGVFGEISRRSKDCRRGDSGKVCGIVAGMACFCVMAVLYQGLEGSLASEYGVEAAFASRVAWPTVWLDSGGWSEDLRSIAEDVSRQAGFNPENMEILCQRLKEDAEEGAVRGYYLQIARHAWEMHSYMVVRQIGWDVLGYLFTSAIVPLQLQGEAYDSFTGRNYEVMGEHAPALTSCYVRYGCWWFLCCMTVSLCVAAAGLVEEEERKLAGRRFKRCAAALLVCGFASGVLAALLAMRGAGLMDYKSAAAVNELWLAGALIAGFARKQDAAL